jgi:hypothetical protein
LVGWDRGSVEVVNIGTGVVAVFCRIGVVEHISLGVVLLFCMIALANGAKIVLRMLQRN